MTTWPSPTAFDLTGMYRLEVVANLSGTSDSYLFLYENSFDPANPLGNALLEAENGGSGLFSLNSITC